MAVETGAWLVGNAVSCQNKRHALADRQPRIAGLLQALPLGECVADVAGLVGVEAAIFLTPCKSITVGITSAKPAKRCSQFLPGIGR